MVAHVIMGPMVVPATSACHKMFSAVQYHEIRDECRELSRQELDLRALTARSSRTWWETEGVLTHKVSV